MGFADIDSMHWTRVPRGCQLGVRVRDGVTHNFIGFREKVHGVLSRALLLLPVPRRKLSWACARQGGKQFLHP
jgi:hypothetical protein